MNIGEICSRTVVVAETGMPVQQAAKLMRDQHVGALVVIEGGAVASRPIGIVTDRDLVVDIMAPGLDPDAITVGDIMVLDLDFATVKEDTGVFEAIQYMRSKGVRRLPVVSDDGALVGIVTLDDLLMLLAEELDTLARLVVREQQKEVARRH
jgi:CBS domain-containing protein